MTIGIPRALIYWKRPCLYFWETFFEKLGCQVLVSPLSNKEIVEMGVKKADPETCFSNKVFWGHLLWLEGKVDYIFIPLLKANEEKMEYCPKFFGLPDLAKILVKTAILTETFDERKEKFEKSLGRLGKRLNKDEKEVEKAIKAAFLKEKEIKEKDKEVFFRKILSEKPKIILISHPYNLHDTYLNLRIKEKLEKLGAEVIFIDEVPSQNQKSKIKSQRKDYPEFHWEFCQEIMKKIQEILKYKIAGIIELSSFQCGCDAVLKEFVEREFKHPEGKQASYEARNKIPFLYLIIDEQTADAGMQTRLEAFIDVIQKNIKSQIINKF